LGVKWKFVEGVGRGETEDRRRETEERRPKTEVRSEEFEDERRDG